MKELTDLEIVKELVEEMMRNVAESMEAEKRKLDDLKNAIQSLLDGVNEQIKQQGKVKVQISKAYLSYFTIQKAEKMYKRNKHVSFFNGTAADANDTVFFLPKHDSIVNYQ